MKNLDSMRHSPIWKVPVLFVLILVICSAGIKAATIYGVTTGNQLIRFDSAAPGLPTTVGTITGLQTGENILGIDFRPVNGQLYGLGSTSRLYTINRVSGAATAIGSAGAFALNGTDFGFDFNPTVDRIRVVSNTGQNLRLNPDTGALAATDTPLNPGTPNVNASAYTNNFAGASSTTLYAIDTTTNSLYTQNPPNNGTLNLVGGLGVVSTSSTGFDIASSTGIAYAALNVGGVSRLYTVDLTTGLATLVGTIGSGTALRGLAVAFTNAVNGNTALDFDGDGRTDNSVFRTTNNTWLISRSSNGSSTSIPWGLSQTDILTPGDYDGDGRSDVAVWRPTDGIFYVLRSSDNMVQYYPFGQNGDEPIARDYDGDGRTDFAVVRRTNGTSVWYITNSSNNTVRIAQFGFDTDIVTPGDYDGDGRFDLAVRRGTGNQPAVFYLQRSTAGFIAIQWGLGGDIVVPGDYDGDGKTDLTALRQGTTYTWYVLRSSNSALTTASFGGKPQFSAQGDYDGDGRTDFATWDPQLGIFYSLRSSTGTAFSIQFGQNGDYPVANFDSH